MGRQGPDSSERLGGRNPGWGGSRFLSRIAGYSTPRFLPPLSACRVTERPGRFLPPGYRSAIAPSGCLVGGPFPEAFLRHGHSEAQPAAGLLLSWDLILQVRRDLGKISPPWLTCSRGTEFFDLGKWAGMGGWPEWNNPNVLPQSVKS